MHSITRIATSSMASLALIGATIASAGAVDARGGEAQIRASGDCSRSATWKLKVKQDDAGKLETEFEVDQDVNGARWRVVLKNDNVQYFNAIRTTHAPGGSFTVSRKTADGTGKDVITATARNLATGETCDASVAA